MPPVPEPSQPSVHPVDRSELPWLAAGGPAADPRLMPPLPVPPSQSRKLVGVILALLAIVVLGGATVFAVAQGLKPSPAPAPTPTPPVSAAELQMALPSLTNAYQELDANLVGLDAVLADQQESLSE